MPYEKAVDEAVKWCIENEILKDVLEEERSAVMLEMLTQFDEKSYEEGLREEGREEGLEEGLQKGREEGREEQRLIYEPIIQDLQKQIRDLKSKQG